VTYAYQTEQLWDVLDQQVRSTWQLTGLEGSAAADPLVESMPQWVDAGLAARGGPTVH